MPKLIEAKELRALEKKLRKTDPHWRTTMRLARTARDEAEKMAKKGFYVDKNELQKLVFSGGLADSAEKVREQVRSKTKVMLDNGNIIRADLFLEVKERIRRFNLGVEMYNLYHAKEIKARKLKRRYKKPMSIGLSDKETQADVDDWVDNVMENYKSSMSYWGTLRGQYIHNLYKALDEVTYPSYLQSTGLKEFIKQKLSEKVPEHFTGDEGERAFYTVYEETLGEYIKRMRELAEQFHFEADYDAFVQNNKLLASLI